MFVCHHLKCGPMSRVACCALCPALCYCRATVGLKLIAELISHSVKGRYQSSSSLTVCFECQHPVSGAKTGAGGVVGITGRHGVTAATILSNTSLLQILTLLFVFETKPELPHHITSPAIL